MVSRCIWLAIGSLALRGASLVGAQENLEQGKTLYESQCKRCHQSPKNVTTFHGGLGLETFLGEQHYADSPESAAAIAAYLKGLERERPIPRRQPKRKNRSQPTAHPLVPTSPASPESKADPVTQVLKKLFE
jgi:cytochrome c